MRIFEESLDENVSLSFVKQRVGENTCKKLAAVHYNGKDISLDTLSFLEIIKEIYTAGVYSGKQKATDNECKAYREGYSDGYADGERVTLSIMKLSDIMCPRCQKRHVTSLHHIVPREHGGGDNVENLILLCHKCHDEVELKTAELYRNGHTYEVDTLRTFVVNEFPEMVLE